MLLQLHTSFYEFSGLRKYDLNSMLLCTEPILNFDEDEIIKSFLWNLLPFQDFTTVTPYHTSSSTKDLRYLMVSKDIHSHFSSAIRVLKIGKTKKIMFPVRITNAKMRHFFLNFPSIWRYFQLFSLLILWIDGKLEAKINPSIR